jgi:hypothetical protein
VTDSDLPDLAPALVRRLEEVCDRFGLVCALSGSPSVCPGQGTEE